MTTADSIRTGPKRLKHLRAFTLVELMVAVTGGLFISIIVFAMARQGTRFYQQESRMAEATLAATIGMQRLRADIGRAGYMASPFINSDPNLCTDISALSGITLLQNLRSIQISQDNTIATNNADLQGGAITPDLIQLSGAYQSADRFIAGYMPPATTGGGTANISIPLQPSIGALVRYRYGAVGTDNAALLNSLFPKGRALRLVNQYGKVAYAVIESTTTTGGPNGALPAIILRTTPVIPLRGQGGSVCDFAGVGVEVNVVNFYRYRIADVQHDPSYGTTMFGQLYLSTANPWDAHRTELIREELDPILGGVIQTPDANGTLQPATPEIIAEYAVDLKFEVTYGDPWPNPTQLITTSPTTAQKVYAVAGTDANSRPQKVRSVRVRLSVRSREADRATTIQGTGLYRLGITPPTGQRSFARVRTLQADVAIPNHFGVNF